MRWEYKVLTVYERDDLEYGLSVLGQDCWELCTVIPRGDWYTFIMKRPLP